MARGRWSDFLRWSVGVASRQPRTGGLDRWASGMDHRFGLGPFLIADGRILVLDDHGELTMAAANPDGFRLLARAKVLDGHDSWGPMALAGGLLIVRDLTTVACLDLRKN